LDYKGVEYNIGPSPDDLVLNLVNEQEYVITPLWNVIGVINGTIADEVVVLGNHRDAWIAGGAGDPNSGSAAFNEVIRSFGLALKTGWKPMRTIVFASWDGEEYGLIGSTEWVEEFLPWLSGSAVAYLNVDVGSVGPHFKFAAAPLLNQVVQETRKLLYFVSKSKLIRLVHLVSSPNQTTQGQSVYDVWDKHIATMGSGSDFTAFQDFAGIPSIDMGFEFGSDTAVYHYHSNYDSFDWMERFGDPSFDYHATIAKVWALVAAKLVETPVLQLNATEYSIGLEKYIESVKTKARHTGYGQDQEGLFDALDQSAAHFRFAATLHDATAAQLLYDYYNNDIPWWKPWEKVKLYLAIRTVNTKYKLLERKFLYPEGLDGRPWFKHVVFAPGKWSGYAGATFPGIVEGIDEKNDEGVRKWLGIASRAIDGAADWLEE
jgi:N-acetylated-alpha-linked acidic dipeptidase